MNTKKQSFTLVEVLIFATIISMFFVVAATVAVTSLRNLKANEHRILATRYAEELIEWLRTQKEKDYYDFLNNHTIPCRVHPVGVQFSCSPIRDWPNMPGACESSKDISLSLPSGRRVVTLTQIGCTPPTINRIQAQVTVSWSEGMGPTPYFVQQTVDLGLFENL